MPWQRVAPASAIPPGDYAQVEVDGVLVAVFNIAGEFYAIDDCARTTAASWRAARSKATSSFARATARASACAPAQH